MKSIIFRSIGVSLFMLTLSLFTFADDGDMTTGSKAGTGGSAPISTTEVKTDSNNDSNSNEDSLLDFFSWIEQVFADVLS